MEKLPLISIIVLTIALFANVAFAILSNDIISPERISPSDTVKEDQIKVYKDRVVIQVDNAGWSEYENTNSMDPIIDSGANGIVIAPKSEEELKVGDIVSYQIGSELVVHRISGISKDSLGTLYTMKGDNNSSVDPEKVRFNQIKYKTIAIIY